ncbi:hypothetical protein HJG60_009365 [Phyllostomus discolor]|uniref:Uncharacterized protein n=1 Tax=Phyllostomus discolor TaxID=89673 RepID=A0A833YFJ9_9CHIR|nr:hypothetical protein HJG60_009365 [Phyllostomus discolor]
MKVQQGVNTLTLTSDPAGSPVSTRLPFSVLFLPEPSLRSPSYPLPLSLFNSFLRSLTPPSGPSPGPGLPPLALSQTGEAGTFWGPRISPGGQRSLSKGCSHAHPPEPGDSGRSRRAKGRDWDRVGGCRSRTARAAPPPDCQGHKPVRKLAARLPPPFSLLGLSDRGRKAKGQRSLRERTKCLRDKGVYVWEGRTRGSASTNHYFSLLHRLRYLEKAGDPTLEPYF